MPAKVEHLAILANLSEVDADRALRRLVNRSLAVSSGELQYFTLVPMVADFLRKQNPKAVAETGDRLEKRAYELIVRNGYKKYDLFPILDTLWPSVAPALPRFLAGSSDRLQIVCAALATFLNFTGRWDERLVLSRQAEAKAVLEGDHINAGWRAYQAGRVHRWRMQPGAVLDCADRALTHWHSAGAGAGVRAHAIRLRGVGHRLNSDHQAAIAAYREALEMFRSISAESSEMVNALVGLANSEKEYGDFVAAERGFCEALRIARAINHKDGEAISTGNLALLALGREDWEGAEALARVALPLSERIGRRQLIAGNHWVLAKAMVRQDRREEGLPYARRAVDIYTQLDAPELGNALETLGECERLHT